MSQQPPPDHIKLIHNLNLFKIKGRDKRGRKILKIIGKHFPAKSLNADMLKKYLEVKVFPKLERPFVVVYVHTDVCKSENFPGFSVLRTVYDAIPINVKQNLESVYFVHPDLHYRVFLATFGRIIFSGGLSYLWDHVKRNEIQIPEFVHDHDDDLEYRLMMDYGLESDHPRVYDAPLVSTYSMRCIS